MKGKAMSAKMEAAEPLELTKSIEYAENAIVSKLLLKNKAGSVTLFAFDAAQELSEHSAPYDALVQVIEGVVELKIAEKIIQVDAGQLVLMPADIPHAVKALRPFKMLLTMIRG